MIRIRRPRCVLFDSGAALGLAPSDTIAGYRRDDPTYAASYDAALVLCLHSAFPPTWRILGSTRSAETGRRDRIGGLMLAVGLGFLAGGISFIS